MRFQMIQMLLVAAICAVLFHGAFSTPSPSSNLDDDLIRSDNDNEESDQNPMLIYLAKGFIKLFGCVRAVKSVTEKCGVRQLPIPQKRSAEEDELDELLYNQSRLLCLSAKLIRRFCRS